MTKEKPLSEKASWGDGSFYKEDVKEAVEKLKEVMIWTYEKDDEQINIPQIELINKEIIKKIDKIFGEFK